MSAPQASDERAPAQVGAIDAPRESAIGRIVRDMTRYLPSAVIPYLIAPATAAVYTRVFLRVPFGVYALAIVLAGPISDGLSTWIVQPTARYYAEFKQQGRGHEYEEVVSVAAATMSLLALVVGGAAFTTLWLTGALGSYAFLWLGALVYCVTRIPWSIGLQAVRSSLQPNTYLVAVLANAILAAAIPLTLIFLVSRNVQWLMWGLTVAQIVVLPYVLAAAKIKPWSIRLKLDAVLADVLKRFAAYGLPMTVWWVGSTVLSVEDRYVIAAFRGASQVATYSVNYQLINGLTSLLNGPILLGFGPVLYSYWSRGLRDDVQRAILQMTSLYLLLIMCFVGGVVVVGPAAADLVIGPRFRVGLPLLLPLAVGMSFYGIALIGHSTVVLGEGNGAMATSAIVAGVLNLALNLALVPFYGYIAAAYSTAIAYGVYALFIWWQSKSFIRWHVDLRTLVTSLGAAVAATLISIAVSSIVNRNLEYAVRGLTYLLIFATLAVLFEGRRQVRSFQAATRGSTETR